jgi:hypothetical protein
MGRTAFVFFLGELKAFYEEKNFAPPDLFFIVRFFEINLIAIVINSN